MGAADAAAPETRVVMDMTRREFPPFDEEDFDTHDKHSYAHKDSGCGEGQKHDFHRQFGFSDAKVAIKFKL